ncbi:MAG: Gldg family protein [Verrucomicrobia bacterium]|nr:Gldg family protein [Verrucomicrobiota bacterium]
MKSKSIETYLYSAVGVVAMLALLAGLNVILAAIKVRWDVTADNAHTLSAGTRAILAKLDTPVKARFYFSQVENATPQSVALANYARQVEDVLNALRQASKGKLIVEKYNPQPDSDAEDSAKLDGIEGQPMPPYGEAFYLGIAFSQLDAKVALPFLTPARERLLEYDMARAISRVTLVEKPVVGVMSALPVFGMPSNPMMMQMGQQGQDPWLFINELQRDFDVREVQMTAETIDPAIRVLVVIYPRDITEVAQYAIDQFVLRGGKLLAFLDPMSIADNRDSMMNPLQRASAGGSNLEKLLGVWGVEYDAGKVLADMTYKTMIGGRDGRPQESPTVLSLTRDAINAEDIVTSQLDNLLLAYPGAFSGTPAAGLTRTVLLKSSPNSQLIEKMLAQFGGVDRDFKPDQKEYALAIRLTGKFKTAFPDGKPGAAADSADTTAQPAEGSLKESSDENSVILVADSDIMFDPVVARVQNLLGFRIVDPLNGNLNFGQSLVELMAGDSNLIAVRSRATLNRPFTVVRQMEEKAQDSYRNQIRQLEQSAQETQQRLSELQSAKSSDQRFVLSPEQQDQLTKLRQTEAQVNRELKDVRRRLRQDVDSLQNWIKALNIAAMPLAVTLTGILAAFYKRKKTAAK